MSRLHDFIDMLLRGLTSPVPTTPLPEEPEAEPEVEARVYTEPLLDRVRTSD